MSSTTISFSFTRACWWTIPRWLTAIWMGQKNRGITLILLYKNKNSFPFFGRRYPCPFPFRPPICHHLCCAILRLHIHLDLCFLVSNVPFSRECPIPTLQLLSRSYVRHQVVTRLLSAGCHNGLLDMEHADRAHSSTTITTPLYWNFKWENKINV